MSKLDVKKFYELAEKDLELAKKLAALDQETNLEASDLVNLNEIVNEKIIPLAKEQGLNFTADELVDYANERYTHLSEDDLLEVSGGVSPKVAGLGLAAVLTLSLGGAAAMNFIHSDDGMPVSSPAAPETSVSTDADNLNDENLPENFAKLLGKTGVKSGTNEEDMPSDAEMEEFQSFLKQLSAARSKAGDKSRATMGTRSASQDDVDMDELNQLLSNWEQFMQETGAAKEKKAASQILNAPTPATSTFNTEDVLESFGVKPKGAPSVSAEPAASVEPTAAKRDEVVLIDEARTDEDFINSEETTNVGKWDEIAKHIVKEYSVRARGSSLTDDAMATFSDELGAIYGKEDGVTYNAESKHLQIAVNKSEAPTTIHVLQLLQHENEHRKINMLLSNVQEELLGVTDAKAKSKLQQEFEKYKKESQEILSDRESLGINKLKSLHDKILTLLGEVKEAKAEEGDQTPASGDGAITTAEELKKQADELAGAARAAMRAKIRDQLKPKEGISDEKAYAKELAQAYLAEHPDVTATYDESKCTLTFSVTGKTSGWFVGTNSTTRSASVDVLEVLKLENDRFKLTSNYEGIEKDLDKISNAAQKTALQTRFNALKDQIAKISAAKKVRKAADTMTALKVDIDAQLALETTASEATTKKDEVTKYIKSKGALANADLLQQLDKIDLSKCTTVAAYKKAIAQMDALKKQAEERYAKGNLTNVVANKMAEVKLALDSVVKDSVKTALQSRLNYIMSYSGQVKNLEWCATELDNLQQATGKVAERLSEIDKLTSDNRKQDLQKALSVVLSDPKEYTWTAKLTALDKLQEQITHKQTEEETEVGAAFNKIIDDLNEFVKTQYEATAEGEVLNINGMADTFRNQQKKALEDNALLKEFIVFTDDGIIKNTYNPSKTYEISLVPYIDAATDKLYLETGKKTGIPGATKALLDIISGQFKANNKPTDAELRNIVTGNTGSMKMTIKTEYEKAKPYMSVTNDGKLQIKAVEMSFNKESKAYEFKPGEVVSTIDLVEEAKKLSDEHYVDFGGETLSWDGTVESLFNCLKAADYNRDRITNIGQFDASLKKSVNAMSLGKDGALQIKGGLFGTSCGTGKNDIKHKIMLKAIALCAQDGNKLQEFNTSIKVKKNASIEDCKFDANDLAKLKSEIK